LAHKGIEEVAEPRFESRPGAEYKFREDGVQSRRLSWLQASEGSSKLLQPKGLEILGPSGVGISGIRRKFLTGTFRSVA